MHQTLGGMLCDAMSNHNVETTISHTRGQTTAITDKGLDNLTLM